MSFVLDPSVVIKWYVPEVLMEAAARLREEIEERSRPVAVPRFFFVESANVLWKKSSLIKELSRSDAKGIYSRILDSPFHIVEDEALLLKALDLSLDHSVSVYDGLYLACALQCKAVLVTADAVLVKRFTHSGLSKHIVFLKEFE